MHDLMVILHKRKNRCPVLLRVLRDVVCGKGVKYCPLSHTGENGTTSCVTGYRIR